MSELAERLEILRRIAERGLALAQKGVVYPISERGHAAHLDLWQHMLDELKLVPTGG